MKISTTTKGTKVIARSSTGKQKTADIDPSLTPGQQHGAVAGELAQRIIPASRTVHARNNVKATPKPGGFSFDFPEV